MRRRSIRLTKERGRVTNEIKFIINEIEGVTIVVSLET